MLRFFREIRKKLLSEGKTVKYLKYAIGEIVLVIIGILIALQVNNWNNHQKKIEQEIAILKQFDNDFSRDLSDLTDNYKTHQRGINAIHIILNALENDLPYSDSLDEYFGDLGMTQFISTTVAYESLKSIGLDLISNDTLRSKIIRIQDESYEAITTFDSGMFLRYTFVQETWAKYYNEVSWRAKPLDFEALKKSEEYKTVMRSHAYQLYILQTRLYDKIIQDVEKLQFEIRAEVKRLSD